jgi:hypothetical protein
VCLDVGLRRERLDRVAELAAGGLDLLANPLGVLLCSDSCLISSAIDASEARSVALDMSALSLVRVRSAIGVPLARVRRDFVAAVDLLARGLIRVVAHQVVIREPELVCACALLMHARLGPIALGPGGGQPRAMLGLLGTARARLCGITVLGNRLRPTLLQHTLAPALGRDTTASSHREQQRDHDDNYDHDDHDDQSSGHTLNLLSSFEEASR